jgi:hypothetical protein
MSLAAFFEQIRRFALSASTLENIVLLNFDHRQTATLCIQGVALQTRIYEISVSGAVCAPLRILRPAMARIAAPIPQGMRLP